MMTDQNQRTTDESVEAAQEPAETDETATGADAAEETTEADESPNREAARYRRQLRETETERDLLAARVEAMQRAEVDRIATAAKIKPSGLWASGVDLADLLDDDSGTVDTAKVNAAVDNAVTELGIRREVGGNYVAREGSTPRVGASDSWANALR